MGWFCTLPCPIFIYIVLRGLVVHCILRFLLPEIKEKTSCLDSGHLLHCEKPDISWHIAISHYPLPGNIPHSERPIARSTFEGMSKKGPKIEQERDFYFLIIMYTPYRETLLQTHVLCTMVILAVRHRYHSLHSAVREVQFLGIQRLLDKTFVRLRHIFMGTSSRTLLRAHVCNMGGQLYSWAFRTHSCLYSGV